MVFIATVRPVDGEKLAREIETERTRQAREAIVSREVENGIQENPITTQKFQRD